MSIYVAVKEGDTPKSRGDLLEEISKKLLEAHDYSPLSKADILYVLRGNKVD